MSEFKEMTIEDVIKKQKESNKKSDSKLILRAYNYAVENHGDQCRKSGEPYIIHPLQVAYILSTLELDDETICAALLHDVVEDSNVTLNELSGIFPPEVIQAVDLLTKRDNVLYADYIKQISNNKLATKVKLADLVHNMDKTRLLDNSVKSELLEKYLMAYTILKGE